MTSTTLQRCPLPLHLRHFAQRVSSTTVTELVVLVVLVVLVGHRLVVVVLLLLLLVVVLAAAFVVAAVIGAVLGARPALDALPAPRHAPVIAQHPMLAAAVEAVHGCCCHAQARAEAVAGRQSPCHQVAVEEAHRQLVAAAAAWASATHARTEPRCRPCSRRWAVV